MLSNKQKNVIQSILNGDTIFLTGSPGTGKSFVLQVIMPKLFHKNVGITATTGCAAINVGGTTIHSFFKLKPDTNVSKHIAKLTSTKCDTYKKIRDLDILIIDEVSMLDSILCNTISNILKACKNTDKVFGGIQMIFVGDFFQLPPVTNNFCFLSSSWIELNPKIIELTELIRQTDDKLFQLILAKLRFGKLTKQIYDILIKNKEITFTDIKPTKLYPNNVDVDKINQKEIKKLLVNEPKSSIFIAYFTKDVNDNLKQKLNEYTIFLCVGSQVMITRNINIENELVNGTRGVVVNINKSSCFVKTLNGLIHEINYYPQEYKNNYVKNLTIMFMPIKLAYALTIHKSQGSTIDYLEIDLGSKIFEYGQGYTALSRGKKLENIKIINLHCDSFKVHPNVIKWYQENSISI
jgi:ATP-dependent DNA helicase PIF1